MNFSEHLRQFFGDEVADEELKTLAAHAVATDVRRLKPAICQAVWDSRQQAALGAGDGASNRLNEARYLHSMYTVALDEFRQLTELKQPAEAVADHNESDRGTKDDCDRAREHR